MDELLSAVTSGRTTIEAVLLIAVIVLWREYTAMRRKIIDIVETNTRALEKLSGLIGGPR